MLDGERAFERSRIGVAYRSTDTNRWSALARYEHRYDRNQDFEAVETTRRAHVLAGHANFQPGPGLILRAQWASKFASQEVGGLEASENAHLAGARATLDVTRRLDLGGIARRLWSSESATSQFGLGLELGLLVADNLRLAGGYNAFGFRGMRSSPSGNTPTRASIYTSASSSTRRSSEEGSPIVDCRKRATRRPRTRVHSAIAPATSGPNLGSVGGSPAPSQPSRDLKAYRHQHDESGSQAQLQVSSCDPLGRNDVAFAEIHCAESATPYTYEL